MFDSNTLQDQISFEIKLLEYALSVGWWEGKYDKTAIRGVLIEAQEENGVINASVFHEFDGAAPLSLGAGIGFGQSGILTQFVPLIFVTAHKLYDMVITWILSENGRLGWRFQEKINTYKRLMASNQLKLPSFFSTYSDLHNAFFTCFEVFTAQRNHAAHKPGIKVDEFGALIFSRANGTETRYRREDILYIVRFGLSVTDCLLGKGDRLNLEQKKRLAYTCAYNLSAHHHVSLNMPLPVFWYRVYYSLAESTLDTSRGSVIRIHLDQLIEKVRELAIPDMNEIDEFEISIHLGKSPWGTGGSYYITPSQLSNSALLELRREDFTLESLSS